MDLTTGWTGRTASALQSALRMSNESFAEHLGIGVRTVAAWHQKPDLRPKPEMQQLLDTALAQAPDAARERFARLVGEQNDADAEQSAENSSAELRLAADPGIATALEWLDQHAQQEPGTARRDVASRIARLDVRALHDRSQRRARVDQRSVADALHGYYRSAPGHGWYTARYGSQTETATSILTRDDWLDLRCPLVPRHDRLAIARTGVSTAVSLDEHAADRALQRLAETLVTDTRLVDMPLFRLVDVDVSRGSIGGSVDVTSFVGYALTMDLLEGELIDALATGMPAERGVLPLRDRYLPDAATIVDLSGRLCAGGTLALCAFARPADPHRGDADYVLLVQERSGNVVNAARRLAVLPKGFHQPMADVRADAQIGATLRREMEEELFGREDVDNTVTDQRRADPMHPSRLSEPMRWLMADPDRWRMECTGFGLNAVSGNFEFASLIVIEDEEFWSRYGGDIKANWEANTLRQFSSLDGEDLADLVHDVAWSNEGLFALLQGLRRLREMGGQRVNLPAIEWTVR
ncbi:MAG: transcriptional regulator [Actinophytocola sp.]|nr:transcriptional regulator [Actinophytocola sp.]